MSRLLGYVIASIALATGTGRAIDRVGSEVYCCDWTVDDRQVPRGWTDMQVVAADRIRSQIDQIGGRRCRVACVEVHSGDKVNGWSGERAEVSAMQDATGAPRLVGPETGHEFYAWSIKVAENWVPPDVNHAGYRWGTCFQLHGPDRFGAPPSLAFMVEDDFHLDLCGGDVTDHGSRQHPRGPVLCRFTDGDLNRGHWCQFLIDVVWAADASGGVTIFRRNLGESNWRRVCARPHIATLQYRFGEAVGPHYWKAGFYRSESQHTNVLWLGPIARGRDRDAVLRAAFGCP